MLTAIRQLAAADFIASVIWGDDDIAHLAECDPALVTTQAFRVPPSWSADTGAVLVQDDAALALLPSLLLRALPSPPAAVCLLHSPEDERRRRTASLLLVWLRADHVPESVRQNPGFLEHLLVGRAPLRQKPPATEARLEAIMAHMPQGVLLVDASGRDAIINAAAARLFGTSAGVVTRRELAGAINRLHGKLRERDVIRREVLRVQRDREARIEDWTWELDDGSGVILRVMSAPIIAASGSGRLWTFDDVSVERALLRELAQHRAVEAKLRQVQKLEIVGRLAAGVAHDFNNLLTIIGGSVEMLEDAPLDQERRGDLHNIAQATERARRLTRQLLTFTRQQVEQSEAFILDDRLRETSSLLTKVLPSKITLKLDLQAEGARVFADPGQIELALLNLLANARDAMPAGGIVHLRTAVETLTGESVLGSRTPLLGEHIAISVADAGGGFDDTTRERMFEPFYTTKAVGRGTGLGLATVLAVAQQCDGGVRCSSVPGAGATFTILLPTHDPVRRPEMPREQPASDQAPTPHLLLVDDEAGPRDTIRRVLVHEGFAVDVAESGVAALRLLQTPGASYDAIVTDYMMPAMTGRELLERVRVTLPELPAVVVSGFAPNEDTAETLTRLHAVFLGKPFTGRQLSSIIRQQIALATDVPTAPRGITDPD
jgi:signal transduction histidine kinase/ActR/RegA family two-component response regulator